MLNKQIFNDSGKYIRIVDDNMAKPEAKFIRLRLVENESFSNNESYHLRVKPDGITIEAGKPAGIFYGMQSLLQLFPPKVYNSISNGKDYVLPCIDIKDFPRFKYRGMHLDVSRHFFPPEFIKRYIDLIVMHKMNRFHWHLTDDNGWRIEIKKYPKLQEISAWSCFLQNTSTLAGMKPIKQTGGHVKIAERGLKTKNFQMRMNCKAIL